MVRDPWNLTIKKDLWFLIWRFRFLLIGRSFLIILYLTLVLNVSCDKKRLANQDWSNLIGADRLGSEVLGSWLGDHNRSLMIWFSWLIFIDRCRSQSVKTEQKIIVKTNYYFNIFNMFMFILIYCLCLYILYKLYN